MLLILANKYDQSVNKVIDWLILFQHQFLRKNDDEIINDITIEESITINDCQIDGFKSVWVRKGGIGLFKIPLSSDKYPNEIYLFLDSELKAVKNFINFKLKTKHFLGSFDDSNKLINLYVAQRVGLSIPLTKFLLKSVRYNLIKSVLL